MVCSTGSVANTVLVIARFGNSIQLDVTARGLTASRQVVVLSAVTDRLLLLPILLQPV